MAATPFYSQIHTTKRFRLLTEKADPAGNIYVYTKGVASLAAGDFVTFDGTGTTTRTLAAGTGPVGVAMSANTATTTFGWVQVSGRNTIANVATHSNGIGKALFLSASAGRASTTPLTESTVYGAFSDGNSVSNVGPVFLRRGVAPGDIST